MHGCAADQPGRIPPASASSSHTSGSPPGRRRVGSRPIQQPMSSRPLSLSELEGLMRRVGLPVRADTLEEAWTEATTPDQIAAPGEQFLLLVSMHARPESALQFEEAVLDFVERTNRLTGP